MVWNWGVAEWDRQYRAGLKPNAMKLQKQWNAVKYQQFPWLSKIHRDAHSRPILNLAPAYKGFFEKRANRPIFKKKGKSRDSFYLANDVFWVDGNRVKIPKIGMVKMREPLRFQGKIMSGTVSRTADKWFISIAVEMQDYKRERVGNRVVGVDLGLKAAATMSDGRSIQPPKPLAKAMKKLRRLSKAHSRKERRSKNGAKARSALRLVSIKTRNAWARACSGFNSSDIRCLL